MLRPSQSFQVEQQEAGVPVPTMNGIVSALRFFFTHTSIVPICHDGWSE